MIERQELDLAVSTQDQLADGSRGPVAPAYAFHGAHEGADAPVAARSGNAMHCKPQPWFVPIPLKRGVAGSDAFLNCVIR